MNYAYDLTLNFNKNYIDFYEWNKEDNIEYYVKVPIFKISSENIYDLLFNDITISLNFLNLIKNKTEKYSPKGVIKCSNISLFTDMNSSIAILFDDKGNIISKSSISIDEESDILVFSKMIKYYLLEYKINSKNKNKTLFLTRNEQDTKKKIYKEIDNLYKEKKYEKLSYIYYEIYNERNENYEKIYYKLINLINNNSEKNKFINDLLFKIKKKSTYI